MIAGPVVFGHRASQVPYYLVERPFLRLRTEFEEKPSAEGASSHRPPRDDIRAGGAVINRSARIRGL